VEEYYDDRTYLTTDGIRTGLSPCRRHSTKRDQGKRGCHQLLQDSSPNPHAPVSSTGRHADWRRHDHRTIRYRSSASRCARNEAKGQENRAAATRGHRATAYFGRHHGVRGLVRGREQRAESKACSRFEKTLSACQASMALQNRSCSSLPCRRGSSPLSPTLARRATFPAAPRSPGDPPI